MHTLIDLFAGCGGMTTGFTQEHFQPIFAVEWDKFAAATYAANHGAHVHAGDIAGVADGEIPDADIIIGGPPCQGFSNLGLKRLDDPRNQLWREYLRFILKVRPKVFVFENVDRFAASPEFEMILHESEHGVLRGYELRHDVLNAADYGVAQRRNRTIIIGSRVGAIELPSPTHAKYPTAGRLPWATVRERIAGLPADPSTTELPDRAVEFFGETMPGIFTGLDLHFRRTPTAVSLARYDAVPPGGGRFDVPDHLLPRCWREKPSGTTDVMGRMTWNAPSLTIRTEFFKPEKGQYLHPQWELDGPRVNRVITHYEASLLQDFPPNYKWVGTKTAIAKQIGNAVPGGLARAIAKQIRQHLDGPANSLRMD